MGIQRRYRPVAEINMGPFADIAFLMIIFFILVTSLSKPLGRLIDIPASARQSDKITKGRPSVTILPDRILFGTDEKNLRPVGADQLRGKLFAMNLRGRTEQQRMVTVTVAKGVGYESFFQVVAAISKAGGLLTLVDDQEQETGP